MTPSRARFAYLSVSLLGLGIGLCLGACSDPAPDEVLVELAPEVISSIDGTTTVQMMVVGERVPLAEQPVRISVTYTDRNGEDHAIEAIDGVTDTRGAFEAVVSGLTWEGTGVVTAEVVGLDVASAATFSVLDRTPPTVEILPPTTDLRVGPGLPVEVEVRVQDEIGVSEVFFEAAGEAERQRTTFVASGSKDSTVQFRFDVPQDAFAGPTITLYAMAADMSGNLAAAASVTLTVDPAVAIATPPGLEGDLLTDGGAGLEDPRALAVSPRDGAIYVADNTGNAPCNGGCIRRVDPTTGDLSAGAVVVANGTMEGVAFDASGDNLYYSDRQNRIGRLTWSVANNRYEGAVTCNDLAQQEPQDPFHLVHDPDLGVLVADDNNQRLVRLADCTGQQPTDASDSAFDSPRGVALGGAGEIFVSDDNRNDVYQVDRDTGDVTLFEDRDLDEPWGMEWLAGGTSPYADSLMIAERGDRTVSSSRGNGTRATAYLLDEPIDVAIAGTTMYVLTRPSNGADGRIFVVTGF